MVLTLAHLAWFVATIPVFVLMGRMFWKGAEFFISAKINLSTLTKAVEKIEQKLDEGMSALHTRVAALERKEDIRHALEEETD